MKIKTIELEQKDISKIILFLFFIGFCTAIFLAGQKFERNKYPSDTRLVFFGKTYDTLTTSPNVFVDDLCQQCGGYSFNSADYQGKYPTCSHRNGIN